MLRRLAQAKFVSVTLSYCLSSPLATLSPSAIVLCLAAIRLITCEWLELTIADVRVCAGGLNKSAPGHHRLLPADPGEITTKFHIEHLIYMYTWTEYKNQIELPVRTRIYSVSEPIICFDSQVISRILRDTW